MLQFLYAQGINHRTTVVLGLSSDIVNQATKEKEIIFFLIFTSCHKLYSFRDITPFYYYVYRLQKYEFVL